MAKSDLQTDEAFGIVPVLARDSDYSFLLIQHHQGHWGFPKGHADPGESALEAACREFTEETGIQDYQVLQTISFAERYTFTRRGKPFAKTVVYFPAWVLSETVTCQADEIQAYAWASFEDALTLLTFNGAKQVLADVQLYLRQTATD